MMRTMYKAHYGIKLLGAAHVVEPVPVTGVLKRFLRARVDSFVPRSSEQQREKSEHSYYA
jgi:hypothetical protein